jgi:hypothetical protein
LQPAGSGTGIPLRVQCGQSGQPACHMLSVESGLISQHGRQEARQGDTPV